MKQILYEIKSQPLVAGVTVIGTALTICLIMIVVMLQQVRMIPIAPETARDRMLYVLQAQVSWEGEDRMMASSYLSSWMAYELGTDLPGVEGISVSEWGHSATLVGVPGIPTIEIDNRSVDAGFFRIFDFNLLAGKYFDESDVQSELKKVIVNRTVASYFYGEPDDAIGHDIMIRDVPYTIVGVVEDVSPITSRAYAQIWTPLPAEDITDTFTLSGLGNRMLLIKAESPDQFPVIRDEINRRVEIAIARNRIGRENYEFTIFNAPMDHETQYLGRFGDVKADRRQRIIIYAILLIIPAINLSSMTRSRLRRRTSEIGVRRAFGCTRLRIMSDILIENFVITLIGSILGLIACILIGSLLFDAIYSAGMWTRYSVPVTLNFSSLLDWHILIYAVLFSFILNLLSTGIPAWQASRIKPVEAINFSNR